MSPPESLGRGLRLKRLELYGFKTFASRAALEFAPGITAIVGPNGSGKSNVADAVRWVLGEQSLKLLRGRRSEDVIFAGGQGKAPAGMAEVSLTLDNAQGLLPVEFSEIAIARRSYRSGEHEYYLNKGRVRLRDVVDVLSRAGIGQNGHSVVGQGLVDVALSLRPEERRVLFEDAGGLRRFQAKKAEAETKLAEVRVNATRVADLLAELEPRVAQLQRQARRAEDEARLRERWREAARALAARQRAELEASLSSWAPDADRLAAAKEEAERLGAEAVSAMAAAREQLVEKRAALNALQQQRAEARERLEAARRGAAVQEERLAAASRSADDLRREVERLAQRLTTLETAQPAATEQQRQSEAALAAAREALAKEEAALAREAPTRDATESGDLAAARGAALETARALTQATTQLRETERQLAGLEKQAGEAEAGRVRAADALSSASQRFVTLEAAAQKARERQEALQRERDAAARALNHVQRRLQENMQQVTALDREIEALNVRLAVLRDVTKQAGAPAKQARREAEAAPALADQLDVPGELEAAVAAALGSTLGWVLVDTPQVAAELALKRGRSGGPRTTYVPRTALDAVEDVSSPPLPAHAGGLGYLSDLLAPRDGVASLLADTYVVQDLPSALRLRAQLDGRLGPTIVTLAGESIGPRGAITAGSPPDEASTLQRLRELREAAQRLAAAEAERTPLRRLVAETQRERDALLGQERRLEGELRTLLQQLSREEGERRGLAQQQTRLQKDLDWWTDFAQRAAGQYDELTSRSKRLSAERQQAQQAHDAAAQRVDGLTRTAAEREAALATLREAVVRARTGVAVAEQRVVQAGEGVTTAAAAASAARTEVETTKERLSKLQDSIESVRAAAAAAAKDAADEEQRLTALEQSAAALSAACTALEGEVERRRGEVERTQVAASQAERDAAMLEAKRATLVERFRALQEQAARDLGDLPEPQMGEESIETLIQRVEHLQSRLRALGPVNQVALEEHAEASERLTFLKAQLADLEATNAALEAAKAELEAGLQADFGKTFEAVAEHFRDYFRQLFGGGDASLALTDPKNLSETGVEIVVQLPGKRRQELASLSGGERALVATCLLFALLKARPSPFCVLDEVDAALDEANVGRFCDTLEELSAQTQFVVITHNRATMERAGALYGVTLGEDGVSRVVSLKLSEVAHDAAARTN